jgi:hypothetical protein
MDWLSVGLIPVIHELDRMALKAMQDSEYSCRWKGVGGFIELTAPQILAIADDVRSHVQSCFDREAELLPLIDAAESPDGLNEIVF